MFDFFSRRLPRKSEVLSPKAKALSRSHSLVFRRASNVEPATSMCRSGSGGRAVRWLACSAIAAGLIASLLIIPAPAAVLDNSAQLEGTVTDPTGAKIIGARVALRDATGAIIYEARTNGEGGFSIGRVAAGRYTLSVEAAGFTQNGKVSIEAVSGKTETVSVRLELAAITDSVVVSATRTETPAVELAGSASVVTGQDLERSSQSLVSEALRSIPGVAVVQTGGRGGLTSIFTRGGESDHNKVLIDGVPVNQAGGSFDFSGLTPENLDRVEVVRGPGSALFGSDAMASVIQLITRRGSTQVPELELSGEGGSFDFHRESARISGVHRLFDYSAGLGLQATDGRFTNSDYVNRSASANLGFNLTSSSDLRITSRWIEEELGVPGPSAKLFPDPDQRQNKRNLSLAGGFNLRATQRWDQTARFIYAESDSHSFDPAAQDLTKPGTPPAPPNLVGPDFAFDFRNHQKRAGFHYQSVAALATSSVLTAGLDYEHESAVFTDPFSRVSPDRNNVGLYIQDQTGWSNRVFVTAGLRIERNTGEVPADLRAALLSLGSTVPSGDVGFGLSGNPKIAISAFARAHREVAAIGSTRLKASFGTGIKEPSLTEAFSPNTFFLGNPALEPERAKSFDAGFVQEFYGRRGSVEVTYFDNRFRDQIVFTFDPITFGPIKLADGRLTNFVNLERTSARGIELIAAARPLRQLRVAGSYTFLRSRQERALPGGFGPSEEGLPLLRRPRHSGSFELSWVGQRVDATLEGLLVGSRRDLDPVTFSRFDASGRPIFSDGYARLNASGSYRFSGSVTGFARMENLLNRDYEEVLGFPAYRLNFTAGLRVRFGGAR